MSRTIVNDHLFDEDEVKYLQDRNQDDLVKQNRSDFGPGGPRENEKPSPPEYEEPDVLELDEDVYDYVVSLDIKHLQSELIDAQIDPTGDEAELRTKVALLLQREKDEQRHRR